MKLEADALKLIAELRATLGQTQRGGCDHACRPKCPVCKARGRARDEKMSRDKRRRKPGGPAVGDPFRGFR